VHPYKSRVAISFTHSRLLRYRAGAGVKPGSLVIEGDLAESWTQPSDTTYVFKLRRGVRFHAKPPVNGRELTAEDVKFTFERMLTEAGSNASMYRAIAKVEAVDRYTVRFTLSEPFAWFLDMVASPMAGGIVARECVEKWGDLKKPEAVIGTGPWMLESYRPNVSLTMVRHPGYFVPGLPYIDRVELLVDEDNASRMAAFLAGRYDLGWEFAGTINRTDWVQIKDRLRQTRPTLRTVEFPSNVVNDLAMRTDQKPWSDVRVRQAVSMAIDRREIIEATLEGVGVVNGPLPAALGDWALPIDQLGEGARNYRHDPAEARRLLAAAGYPSGFPASVCFNSYGSTVLVDTMQLVLKHLKAVGIDARLDQKEYGAYQATCRLGKFDSTVFGPLTPPGLRLLPLRPVLHRGAAQPEPREGPRARRSPGPAAPDHGREGAPRGHQRHPAPSGQAAVLRARPDRDLHRGVERRAQELRPEPGLRLRRAAPHRLARSLSPA
jgi:peptide/nickel transport system substrate-binding protein